MNKDSATRLAAAAALLLAAYGLAYFACAMDGQFKTTPDPRYMRTYTAFRWFASPYYRGFPSLLQGAAQWMFAPAHYLDQHLLRSAKWSGPIRFPVVPRPARPQRRLAGQSPNGGALTRRRYEVKSVVHRP